MTTAAVSLSQQNAICSWGDLLRTLACGLAVNSRPVAMVNEWNDDRCAIEASLNGDGEAFGCLVKKYQATIASQMGRFSRDRQVMEELVHDVFVEMYFSLKTYRANSPLPNWLRKIAVRVGFRYWKRLSSEKEHAVRLTDATVVERLVAGPPSSAVEAGHMLYELLSLLSPRDRLVLTLIYWDGCTVAEVGRLTGWSQSMVKVQAHRARNRMKRLIEEGAEK